MQAFFDFIGRISWLCASAAKLLIGVVILMVIADVVARNFGWRAMTWAISATEYSLLYITFLSMPWLVRIKGHVFVIFLRALFPPAAKKALEVAVYIVCIGLCLYLGYITATAIAEALARGSFESRTFDMPRWAILLPILIGFVLSALEWLRYLMTSDSIYNANVLETEGL